MARKTKKEREAERMELLRKIRDGEKHTRANNVLAPLGQAALIEVLDYYPGGTAKTVKLSAWGGVVLADWEKRNKKE